MPPVSASAARLEKEVMTLFAVFSYLVEAADQHHQGKEESVVTSRFSHLIELLIVDEANRLKDAGLELIRDIVDRGEIGLVPPLSFPHSSQIMLNCIFPLPYVFSFHLA
jgi:hypothetical protein